MDEIKRCAIARSRSKIAEALEPTISVALTHFNKIDVLRIAETELVRGKSTSVEQALFLVDILQMKDNGFDLIEKYLRSSGLVWVARMLVDAKCAECEARLTEYPGNMTAIDMSCCGTSGRQFCIKDCERSKLCLLNTNWYLLFAVIALVSCSYYILRHTCI